MIEPLFPKTLELSLAWVRRTADAGVADSVVLRHVLERVEALEADATEQSRSASFCNEAIVRRLERLESTDRLDTEAWASMRRASCDYRLRLSKLEAAQQQLDALEASRKMHAEAWASMRRASADLHRRLLSLKTAQRQPTDHLRGATKMAPTSEAAPVATDQDLVDAAKSSLSLIQAYRAIYNLDRQHGAAQPPAAELAPVITPYGKTTEQARHDRAAEAGRAAADASVDAVLAAQPTPPPAPAGGLLERVAAQMTGNDDPNIDAFAAIHEVAEWLDLEGYVRAANHLREKVAQ
jgi:hypothetical protein